jgi:zinc transporter 2
MGFVLHSEKCCGVAKRHSKFGHGHSHSHGNGHGHSHSPAPYHDQYDVSGRYNYEPLDVARSQTQPDQHSLSDEGGEEGGEREGEEGESAPHKNINVRAAFIHVIGDIIQSVGVLVAALIIKFKVSVWVCVWVCLC